MMSRHYKYIMILFLVIISTSYITYTNHTININDLTNKTWRIDQLYADSSRLLNTDYPFVDSLRFTFQNNGQFQISDLIYTGTGTWQTNAEQTKIFTDLSSNSNFISKDTLNISFLNSRSFVYTLKKNDTQTNKPILLEFRLVPSP